MPPPSSILAVENLSVRLGDVEVLRRLSFSVDAGAVVAIIGPNGSGKTMLFRALIGAIPYEGTVRWAANMRVGYVPQKLDLDRDLPITGRDLLRARSRLAKLPTSAIDAALVRVGLDAAVLDRLVGALSGGQFQRLLMAFALLADPTVMLLDEPTTGIDEPGQERVNDTVRRLQSEGVTILMISHDLSVVHRYATMVLCLTRNHACFGVARGALTPQLLADVYGEPVALYGHDDDRS